MSRILPRFLLLAAALGAALAAAHAAAPPARPELPREFRASVVGKWLLGEDAKAACHFSGFFFYSDAAKRYRYDVVVEDPSSPLCQTVTHGMTDIRFFADASDKANPATGSLDMVGRPAGAAALACVHLSSAVPWLPHDLLAHGAAPNGTGAFLVQGAYADGLPLRVILSHDHKSVARLVVPRTAASTVGLQLGLAEVQTPRGAQGKGDWVPHPEMLALPEGLRCVAPGKAAAAAAAAAGDKHAAAAATVDVAGPPSPAAAGPARRRKEEEERKKKKAAVVGVALSLG